VRDLYPEARRPLSSRAPAPLGSLATAASLRARLATFVARICILGLAAGLLVIQTSPLPAQATAPPPGTISTAAGGGIGVGLATTVPQRPWGLAFSGTTLYIADQEHSVIRVLNTGTGMETVLAGTGVAGFTGDGAQATAAQINPSFGLAIDSSGNVYIATGDRIRRVDTLGVITTVAGGGSSNPGDGGLATSAVLAAPEGVAIDSSSNIFIADSGHHRIRKVDHLTGLITSVAGNGTAGFSGDGLGATSAQLNQPEGVWVDGSNNIWIADSLNNRLREVVGATINTVAGGTSGNFCFTEPAGSATLYEPSSVWVDGSGSAFIADQHNNCVRQLSGGTVTTVAGSGSPGYSGDGGPAASAQLFKPVNAVKDGSGNLYLSDFGNARVRRVDLSGTITTVAGTGLIGGSNFDACVNNGDGGQATNAILCDPYGVAADGSGNLFIADSATNLVRQVTPGGVISTFAGGGNTLGDGGPATSAQLSGPAELAIDSLGNLYIADTGNRRVRKVSAGIISTVAGGGTTVPTTTPEPATSARITPRAVAFDSGGNLFIADTSAGLIEKVAGGNIVVVAGGGNSLGDGGPATSAQLVFPGGVVADTSGNLYIADTDDQRIRKVDLTGTITTFAFVGAVSPGLPDSIAIAPGGQIVVSTFGTVVMATSLGLVTVAGGGSAGLDDGGLATAGQLGITPRGLAFDASGDLFIADEANTRVRKVAAYNAPGAPTGVSAVASNHSASVAWTAPASNGGLTVIQYTVTPYQGVTPGPPIHVNGQFNSQTGLWSPPPTSAVIANLQAGVSYTFKVSAFNGWGMSADSAATSPVTPLALAPRGNIITYAGSVGRGPALSVGQYPYSVALAGAHLYIGDFANPVVRDVDLSTGQEGALAGNDSYGYSGDGGQATSATIQGAGAIAYCGGQTYIADTFNYVIRKIDVSGNITTFAGTGQFGYNGDGGPATSARIGRVFGLACRTSGGLYVSDSDNGAVRIIDAGGTIRTWWHGFSFPTGITELGSADVVAVADSGGDNSVWQLTDQTFSLLAGIPGTSGYNGDGSATSAELNDPRGLAWFGGSPIYIADRGNNRIRQISGANIATVAGMGVAGFSGDNGPATSAELNGPSDVFTADGVLLWVADSGNFRVRKINFNAAGTITSIAGNGTPSLSGDGGPATLAQLGNPYAVAVDSAGNLFIADNQNAVIRKVDPTGTITTIAGNGVAGFSGDGGSATTAELKDPRGVAVASNGDVYISDTGNQRVRKVDHSTGVISTVVGNGVASFAGDGGLATLAELNFPRAVAVDTTGNLYIADTANNRVRMVNPSGTITTFAGTGTAGYSGDGGPATAANMNQPRGLAIDASSNVYIGDTGSNRVRRVDHASGNITTVAGNGKAGLTGDGHAATSAELNFPFGLALDAAGYLYIADANNQRIRVVDTRGNIDSVVGTCGGVAGFSGDGGPASAAHVNFPYGVAVDGFGDLFIADVDNNRVRGATGLVGLRGSACPGPAGSAGSRSTNPSGSSPPPPRIVDSGGSAHKFANDTVLPSRVSSFTIQAIQPARAAAKLPAAQPAPVTKPGPPQANPPAAQKAPAAGPIPARGRAPAATMVSSHPQASWARPDSLWWILLVPVALLTVAMTLTRRRSKSLKRYRR
jgi:sugar lactone lactonase YvrE